MTPPPDRGARRRDPDGARRDRRALRGPPPGRPPTGWRVTRRWFWVTAAVLLAATAVLVALVI